MRWTQALPAPLLTTIGLLQIAGGIGLIAPAATRILPVLTTLAAIALVVLTALAATPSSRAATCSERSQSQGVGRGGSNPLAPTIST